MKHLERTPYLYLDLDQTFADFDGGFHTFFGSYPWQVSREQKWELVRGHGSFFSSLPMLPGAREFFERVRILNPAVLTGCPGSYYKESATQKRTWSRTNLDEHIPFFPVNGSINKYLFMHKPGDVIIDDRGDVCRAWEEAGGNAIHFEGNYAHALVQLKRIYGHF